MKLVKGLVVFALGFGLGAALIPTLHDPPQLEPATTTATALVMRGSRTGQESLNNTTTTSTV